ASEEGRKQYLQLLIREKILLQEARRSGLPNDESYRKAVREFKKNAEARLKEYKETLLIESYLRKLRAKDLAASDADVKKFYEAHAAEYAQPVEVQAQHILVNSEAEAAAALQRVKNGESFEKVAQQVSKDPASAARGG